MPYLKDKTMRWDRIVLDTCIDCLTAPAVGCVYDATEYGSPVVRRHCDTAAQHAKRCKSAGTFGGRVAWNPRCSSCHKGEVRAWAKDAGLTYSAGGEVSRKLPTQPVSDAVKRHKAWVRAIESKIRTPANEITKARLDKAISQVRAKGRKLPEGKQLEIEGTTITAYNDTGRLAAWRRELVEAEARFESARRDWERELAMGEIGTANNAIRALERKLGLAAKAA